MKQVNKLQLLKALSFFDTNTISQITGKEGNALYKNIARWIQQDKLIQLKKGVYTTQEYYLNLDNKNSYLEFVSNKLRFPSYLSLEYVLTLNQVLSESVFAYTAITLKTTRSYRNKLGRFTYRNIKPSLFNNFEIIVKDGFEISQADKTKALFDFLYLKFLRQSEITQTMTADLRLNLDEYTQDEISQFDQYCRLTKIKKYQLLTNLLFPNYAH